MARTANTERRKTASRASAIPLPESPFQEALFSWLVPVVAGVIGAICVFGYNLGLISAPHTVLFVVAVSLIALGFYGLRVFLQPGVRANHLGIIAVFAALWGIAMWYPFWRSIDPGVPVATGELKRGGSELTLPMNGEAGRFRFQVHGSFVPREGRLKREGTYAIEVGHAGQVDQIVAGTLLQEWKTQRFGIGRRSSTIQVLKEHNERTAELVDGDGHDLTVRLKELSPELADGLRIQVFHAGPSTLLRFLLAVAALAGSILVDAARPENQDVGLMSTLTVGVVTTLALFVAFEPREPPQLLIAGLAGLLAGAVGGLFFSRLAPLLRVRLGWR